MIAYNAITGASVANVTADSSGIYGFPTLTGGEYRLVATKTVGTKIFTVQTYVTVSTGQSEETRNLDANTSVAAQLVATEIINLLTDNPNATVGQLEVLLDGLSAVWETLGLPAPDLSSSTSVANSSNSLSGTTMPSGSYIGTLAGTNRLIAFSVTGTGFSSLIVNPNYSPFGDPSFDPFGLSVFASDHAVDSFSDDGAYEVSALVDATKGVGSWKLNGATTGTFSALKASIGHAGFYAGSLNGSELIDGVRIVVVVTDSQQVYLDAASPADNWRIFGKGTLSGNSCNLSWSNLNGTTGITPITFSAGSASGNLFVNGGWNEPFTAQLNFNPFGP